MLCAKQMVLVFAGASNKLEFDVQANIELTQIRFTEQIFPPNIILSNKSCILHLSENVYCFISLAWPVNL